MTIAFKDYPYKAKTYAPRLPPLVDGVDRDRPPVVIVGAGPVGLSLALGLSNYGIRSVVIEADDTVCFGSRAICISRRSLEIIERLGALEGFLSKGLPWTGGRSYYRNTEVLHFVMPHDENQKLPPMLNIEQFYIEQFLLDEVERRPDLIDIRWDCRVTGVDTGASGATLELSTALGDYRLETDWLVGCDGGRSFVREALGLELKGTSYEGRYVIVDIELKNDLPTERLAWFDPPSNPGSSILMHRQPDGVWRIDYQLGKHEDADEAIKPENVIPRVQSHLDMIGQTGPWAPIWITMYKAHALSLESYHHGRVLFAGDAAHLVPIFGVRGANSGFDDADNLAWKLAFRIKGLAGDGILDSYSAERVYAAQENLGYGTKSTEFMAPPSFAFEVMRQAVLTLAVDHPEVRSLINPRQTVNITYQSSPLNNPADDSGAFTGGPVSGGVLPECPIEIAVQGMVTAGFVTDLARPRFTALCFSEDGTLPSGIAELEAEMATAGVPFVAVAITRRRPASVDWSGGIDVAGRLFALYGASAGTCYLVRPDGHVQSRWTATSPAAIRAAIAYVLNPSIQEAA